MMMFTTYDHIAIVSTVNYYTTLNNELSRAQLFGREQAAVRKIM